MKRLIIFICACGFLVACNIDTNGTTTGDGQDPKTEELADETPEQNSSAVTASCTCETSKILYGTRPVTGSGTTREEAEAEALKTCKEEYYPDRSEAEVIECSFTT